jgi:hypothetical protein
MPNTFEDINSNNGSGDTSGEKIKNVNENFESQLLDEAEKADTGLQRLNEEIKPVWGRQGKLEHLDLKIQAAIHGTVATLLLAYASFLEYNADEVSYGVLGQLKEVTEGDIGAISVTALIAMLAAGGTGLLYKSIKKGIEATKLKREAQRRGELHGEVENSNISS